MKKDIKFSSFCHAIGSKINNLKLPFHCYPPCYNYMWINSEDKKVGGAACHYEIREEDDDVYVELHFEANLDKTTMSKIDAKLKGLGLSTVRNNYGYKWYRHNGKKFDMSYLNKNGDDNINAILQELCNLHEKFGDVIEENL